MTTGRYIVEITPQNCAHLFTTYGMPARDQRLIKNPESVALVIFTGGHDVSPSMYNENVGSHTGFSKERDAYESEMFDIALKHKIPMVGICRGSQFLCVKAGGKLCQDILNHGGRHKIVTKEGKTLSCNSTHHQMQLPPASATPLAWAEPRLSINRNKQPHYLNGDDQQIEVPAEYEVVHYPNINAVGIQYHPEWLPFDDECVIYAKEVVAKYLFGK